MKSKPDAIKHEKEYIAFLEKRLASDHFKAQATPEEVKKTQEKLKKARFIFKTLQSKEGKK